VAELAERLGVPPEDVTEAMEMGPAYVPLSLTSRLDRPTGRRDALSLRRFGTVDPELDRVEMRDLLERAMVHLTPRERGNHGHAGFTSRCRSRDREAPGHQPDARLPAAARSPRAAAEICASGRQSEPGECLFSNREHRKIPSSFSVGGT